jgi:transposase
MKNRLYKGAHLEEGKLREILQLFSEDLNATQIAEVTGVSRITINHYLKMIRSVIADWCDRQNNRSNGTSGTDNRELSDNLYFGVRINDSRICVEDILLRGENSNEGFEEIFRKGYLAFIDPTNWQFQRASKGDNKKEMNSDETMALDEFWLAFRHRLIKSRGLSPSTAYLHLKECAFRYNFRNTQLPEVLLKLIREHPLHLTKGFAA